MAYRILIDNESIISEEPYTYTITLNAANNYSFAYGNVLISMLNIHTIYHRRNTKSEYIKHILFSPTHYICITESIGFEFLQSQTLFSYLKNHKNKNIHNVTGTDAYILFEEENIFLRVNYKKEIYTQVFERTEYIPTIRIQSPANKITFNPDIRYLLHIFSIGDGYVRALFINPSGKILGTKPLPTTDLNIYFTVAKYTIPYPDAFKYYNQPYTPSLFSLSSLKIKQLIYKYTYNKKLQRYLISHNKCKECHTSIINYYTGSSLNKNCHHLIPQTSDHILTTLLTYPENVPVQIDGETYKYTIKTEPKTQIKMILLDKN